MKKTLIKSGLALAMLSFASLSYAQEFPIDNMRPNDQRGINTFESPKDTVNTFDGLKVRIGGAFALQFQGLSHSNTAQPKLNTNGVNVNQLYDIGNNFNLATANLDVNLALYSGLNLHLRTFLSSRHHNEAYVKGGYLQIDNLDFVYKGLFSDFFKYATIKFGHDEINCGDAHFRRSDNASTITNPFVGNLLMDAFATMVFGEVYYQRNGFVGMVGVTNGRLNQHANAGTSPSMYGKLGYDKQVTPDLRVRLTGSFYNAADTQRLDFYDGDRAGARYYYVMENTLASSSSNFRSGQVIPDFKNKVTSFMINPFVKFHGLEFFGTFETASGRDFAEKDRRTFNQYQAELLYRFGGSENFYLGGRYNRVNGKTKAEEDIKVDRYNLGGGWFMTKNILVKGEYVHQKYDGYP